MNKDILMTPLGIVKTDGGDVMHAMKKSDDGFTSFGETYFSNVDYKSIKAWKRHRLMTLNLIVPIGQIKFVLFDDRNSKEGYFQEIILSRENYFRLTVPPMVWVGFQGLNKSGSMLLNVADIEHNKNEVDRNELHQIYYKWSLNL